jgi:SGNH hydrolase-like domain, acetyltransferase AlgX
MRGIPKEGQLTIQGWAIGKASVPLAVELSDQSDRRIGSVPLDKPRPDIAEGFPEVPGSSTSGFVVTLRPEGSGASRICVSIVFDDGSRSEMAVLSCRVDGGEDGDPSWSVVAEDREGEKVMAGLEGWLYLRRDSNDILAQHTGKLRFEDEQLSGWRQVLTERMRESERFGAVWSCLVPPDKESAYPEYLPRRIVPVERRPVHEFLDVAAEVEAPVVYPLRHLQEAKSKFEVYPKVDTHWNFRGAYVGYKALCESLLAQGVDLEVLEDRRIEWVDRPTEGDLGSKVRPLPIAGTTIAPIVHSPCGHLTADNGVVNHGRVVSFEQKRPGLRCVVFGESFTPLMLPFLKETFQRLVFVHTSMFVTEILEQERPDVIVSLPTERFLIRVPNDANAAAELRATALRKGGELPWPALT